MTGKNGPQLAAFSLFIGKLLIQLWVIGTGALSKSPTTNNHL
jgi:hypothetical protein